MKDAISDDRFTLIKLPEGYPLLHDAILFALENKCDPEEKFFAGLYQILNQNSITLQSLKDAITPKGTNPTSTNPSSDTTKKTEEPKHSSSAGSSKLTTTGWQPARPRGDSLPSFRVSAQPTTDFARPENTERKRRAATTEEKAHDGRGKLNDETSGSIAPPKK